MNTYDLKIPTGTKRRSGIKMNKVSFLVLHDTGNKNTTAMQNVKYYINSANEMSASAHIFVDDKDVITCIPVSEKAWHVLYDVKTDNLKHKANANDEAIGIELCYFDDKERTQKAYDNYVKVCADLCDKYNLDFDDLSGHEELDPNRKTDPTNAIKTINKTLQDLKNDIIKNKENKHVLLYSIGQKGEHIKRLQEVLRDNNILTNTDIDSIYGNKTEKALKEFSKKWQ